MRDCDRYLCGSCGTVWLLRLRHGDRFGPWALEDCQDDALVQDCLTRDEAEHWLASEGGLSLRAASAVIRASIYWADSRAYETCV